MAAGVEEGPCVVRGRVGYSLLPHHFYDELTLLENLTFYSTLALSYCDTAVIYSVCSLLDLDIYLSHRFGELPWSVRRRAGLSFSLISAAPILVWEEVTAGMGEKLKRRLFELVENEVKGGSRTLLIYSEDPEFLMLSDKVFSVVEDEVVEMSPSDAAARWEEL
jgi:ABC-type multidrug transport system ATPase subunit